MTRYLLMDIERTVSNGLPCYWKSDRHGYTYNLRFAGMFPENVAEAIVNGDKNKRTVMLSVSEVERILGKDLKTQESY